MGSANYLQSSILSCNIVNFVFATTASR